MAEILCMSCYGSCTFDCTTTDDHRALEKRLRVCLAPGIKIHIHQGESADEKLLGSRVSRE